MTPSMRHLTTLLLLGSIACSSGTAPPPGPPPPPAPPPPPPPSADRTVEVQNTVFNPASVTINRGQTVVWIWRGNNHSVTSVLTPTFSPSSEVRSQPFNHGPVQFNTAGAFRYICTVHGQVQAGATSGMAGVVNVN